MGAHEEGRAVRQNPSIADFPCLDQPCDAPRYIAGSGRIHSRCHEHLTKAAREGGVMRRPGYAPPPSKGTQAKREASVKRRTRPVEEVMAERSQRDQMAMWVTGLEDPAEAHARLAELAAADRRRADARRPFYRAFNRQAG